MTAVNLDEKISVLVENVLDSYDTRLQNVENVLTTPCEFLEMQDVITEERKKRDGIAAQIKESLAQNESLRKKDFDEMIQRIMAAQEQREHQVRALLKSYLTAQKQMANSLRESLIEFKTALQEKNLERVDAHKTFLQKLLQDQDSRRRKVETQLKDFRDSHHAMAENFKQLLNKGKQLRIKDLKELLSEFENDRQHRAKGHKRRKEEVDVLLNRTPRSSAG